MLVTNHELDSLLDHVCLPLVTESRMHSPLTVKALRLMLANNHIGCVLVGMRKPAYVQDALLALELSRDDVDMLTSEILQNTYKHLDAFSC
jgi:hypothetical protein